MFFVNARAMVQVNACLIQRGRERECSAVRDGQRVKNFKPKKNSQNQFFVQVSMKREQLKSAWALVAIQSKAESPRESLKSDACSHAVITHNLGISRPKRCI